MISYPTIKDKALEQDGRVIVRLPWYESLRTNVEGGHEVLLLEMGAGYFPELVRAIDEAHDRVYLETYIFQDDPTGRLVAEALARAAGRGVAVHVVLDGFGSSGLAGKVLALLKDSSVRVEVFRPRRKFFDLNRQRLRRLHRKLCVVDGRTAFVGGLNVIDDLYDLKFGRLDHPRVDFALRVRGPLVAHLHVAMIRMWWELSVVNRSLGRATTKTSRFGPPEGSLLNSLKLPEIVVSDITPAGDTRAGLVLRDNFRNRRTIENWYLRRIARAKREVLIANAYFFPGVRFRRALIDAARRGVNVRLLLQGRVEYKLQDWASHALYDELLREGISIIEYKKSFMHAKVAVIDDQATVGSSNIDPFSLLLAREANVVVRGAAFAAQLRASIERLMAEGGVQVEPRHHRERPWPIRLANQFGYALLRLAVAISGVAGKY